MIKIDQPNAQVLNVAVIGAGIVGLQLALGLSQRSMHVTVYEQAVVLQEIGAGFGFFSTVLECQRFLDPRIAEIVTKTGIKYNEPVRWIDGMSKEDYSLRPQDQLFDVELDSETDVYLMHRGQFLQELIKLCPSSQIKLGRKLTHIEQSASGGQLVLQFEDGSSAQADVVIGCDGIKSRTRQVVLGDDHPAAHAGYAHESAYRCLVDYNAAITALGHLARGQMMYLGEGAHIMTYPIANHKFLNVAAFIRDDGNWPDSKRSTIPSGKTEILQAFSAFGPAVQALVQLLPDQTNRWGMFDTFDNPLPTFASGSIAVAGDAAHGSTPHHGAGASMGIEDAVAIAALLGKLNQALDSIDTSYQKAKAVAYALTLYDEARRERSQWLVASSRLQGETVKGMNPQSVSSTVKLPLYLSPWGDNNPFVLTNMRKRDPALAGVMHFGADALISTSPTAVETVVAHGASWTGKIVRYGPNRFSFNDPKALKIIYGPGSQFRKSDWYNGSNVPKPMAFERWNIFATTDSKQHSEQRKPFTNTYSITSLVSFKPYVDECANIFEQRLAEVAGTAVPIDFGHWLQCYAFDVIGDITFGERFGFLDSGRDIGGVIAAVDAFLDYAATVGIFPRLHPILFKLQTMLADEKGSGFNYINNFTQEQITKFRNESKSSEKAALQDEGSMETMLAKFFRRNQEDHERFTPYHIFTGCAQNVGAGSDTTAISLSATFYYLLKNPSTLQRLREEIVTKAEQGQLSEKPTFKETLDMPYLQAVIKEALRLHPATGFPLERVVPEGGATISGRFFPSGIIVGVNTWVVQRNPSIWGDDANEFRPEKWLINDSETLSFMNRHWIPFGVGSRVCIGKNISLLEMQKLIPRVVRKFDLEINGLGDKTWSTRNRCFVKPRDFRVRVAMRKAE